MVFDAFKFYAVRLTFHVYITYVYIYHALSGREYASIRRVPSSVARLAALSSSDVSVFVNPLIVGREIKSINFP